MTTPHNGFGLTGREAEQAAILAEVQLAAELIIKVIGEGKEVVWGLAEIERKWHEVLKEVAEHGFGPSSEGPTWTLASNLVDGLEPESTFDLWFEALAHRLRRCTAWVAESSGMDPIVLDQLIVIENRYTTLMMYALTAPMLRGDTGPSKSKVSATATPDAVPSGGSAVGPTHDHDTPERRSEEVVRSAWAAIAALAAVEEAVISKYPEADGDWSSNVIHTATDAMLDVIRREHQKPSAS